jgi:hypothetical protein
MSMATVRLRANRKATKPTPDTMNTMVIVKSKPGDTISILNFPETHWDPVYKCYIEFPCDVNHVCIWSVTGRVKLILTCLLGVYSNNQRGSVDKIMKPLELGQVYMIDVKISNISCDGLCCWLQIMVWNPIYRTGTDDIYHNSYFAWKPLILLHGSLTAEKVSLA